VTQGTVLTVRDSVISGNYWDGAWCDVGCDGMSLISNQITDNGRAGIHYEISYGPAQISGNTIQDNGKGSPVNKSTPAGLLLQNSQDVDVFDNDFGGNAAYAARFANSASRTPQMARITFRDNRLNGDALKDCPMRGISCTNNTP
jgi:parallel beta-helix repeat protein